MSIATAIETKKIFLSIGTPAPEKMLILLPHLRDPITIKKALQNHPTLYELDGESKDSTLLHYFKWNKEEKLLEPKDEEAELDIAFMLDVKIGEFEDKTEEDTDDAEDAPKELTEEQKNKFHEHIDDIRAGLKKMGM